MRAEGLAVFPGMRLPVGAPLLAAASILAAFGSAVAVLAIGPTAALLPFVALLLGWALAEPRSFALAVLAAGVGIDAAEVDFTSPLARSLWNAPAGIALPLKTNLFELLLLLALASLSLRVGRHARPSPGLPLIARATPFVLLAGFVYGLHQGGSAGIAYNEARGLLFALVAFVVTRECRGWGERAAVRAAFAATSLLGAVAVVRYLFYLQNGRTAAPMEFWFAHETGLFLGVGVLMGLVVQLRVRGDRARLLATGYTFLMAAALLMTGRRSAILVVAAGALVVGWMLLPRRPALLLGMGTALLLVGASYLSVYWDGNSGPLAEPARAVRSQVDPDARDRSSDHYRSDERANVEATLRAHPLFGVGFGRPFETSVRLPELPFWPLQLYTPHQNILWLWLKTGAVGAAVLLGTWVLALRRCLAAFARTPRDHVPAVPLVLAAVLVMYLAYARIDMALVGSRTAVPLGVVLSLAFLQRDQPSKLDMEA
ncbi:MAG: O-antigen ligase family protein [Dehalococcoidia bacterium]|nr:O-antigen ligase family protein [Dehalococcoidia bacterium]